MSESITVNTDKAGWQAFNLQVGDTIVLDKGRLYQVSKIESVTTVVLKPATRWNRFVFWLQEMSFEVKMKWWSLKRRFK